MPVGFTVRAPPSQDYGPEWNLQTIAQLRCVRENEGHLTLNGYMCQWEFLNRKRAEFSQFSLVDLFL